MYDAIYSLQRFRGAILLRGKIAHCIYDDYVRLINRAWNVDNIKYSSNLTEDFLLMDHDILNTNAVYKDPLDFFRPM